MAALSILIAFAAVCVAVIALAVRPIAVHYKRVHFTIGFAWPPLFAVVVLLASQQLTFKDVWRGIKGDDRLQPYAVVALFMSLAFVSVSLDMTGVFAWMALHIIKRTAADGRRLFLFYAVFAALLTTFTGNDVVVLTLTPIICYFAKAAKIDPMPMLVMECFVANVWSMALIIGNPTNIIVGEAINLSFITYSKWMLLPAVVSGVVSTVALWLQFAHQIPKRMNLPSVNPSAALLDKRGAIFGSINLVVCLVVLAVCSSVGVSMYYVTIASAGVQLLFNVIVYDILPKCTAAKTLTVPVVEVGVERGVQLERVSKRWVVEVSEDGNGRVFVDKACGSVAHDADGEDVNNVALQILQSVAADGKNTCADVSRATHAGFAGGEMKTVELAARPELLSLSAPTANCMSMADEVAVGAGSIDKQLHGASGAACCMKDVAPTTAAAVNNASSSQHVCATHAVSGAPPSSSAGVEAAALLRDSAVFRRATSNAVESQHSNAACDEGAAACSIVALPPIQPADPAVTSSTTRPSSMEAFRRMPWVVVPFVFGMFILVQGLSSEGWVDKLAAALAGAIHSNVVALFLMAAVTIVACNLINNQPATILLAATCLNDAFWNKLPEKQRLCSMLAVVVGSNTGAGFTLVGALACIMWMTILHQKGITMGYLRFVWLCAPTAVLATVVALLVLWLEVQVFNF